MKNILILGSSGMAGHVITKYLEEKNYNVIGLSRNKKIAKNTIFIDLLNIKDFDKFLNENRFDFIINCAGILNQFAENKPDKAIFINSYVPRFLERKYINSTTKIIQISTDCVFSGTKGNYKEEDFKDGDTIYARTKSLGELNNAKDLTFRTSIIGPDINENGIGLFNWFMHQKGKIKGFKEAYWTGITTIELAKSIEKALSKNITGLYHLVPKTKINKFDLLNLINQIFEKNIEIEEDFNYKVDKSLINTRDDFDFEILDYDKMIKEMKIWIKNHSELYNY